MVEVFRRRAQRGWVERTYAKVKYSFVSFHNEREQRKMGANIPMGLIKIGESLRKEVALR